MDMLEAFKILNESNELYKGVFWIKDINDLYASSNLMFQIPCNADGDSDLIVSNGASKTGNTYNHERLWKTLSKELTDSKPFNYYPRGRVEIRNGVADIFVNPNLFTEEVKKFLISEYHLNPQNGIKKIRFHADSSEHYKCYLDD